MQRYDIIVSPGALRDLEDISDYIGKHDDPAKAGYVIARIESVIDSLAISSERGSFLPELLSLGMKDYRRIFLNHSR
jgi:plasmid stabilization system protein ParE